MVRIGAALIALSLILPALPLAAETRTETLLVRNRTGFALVQMFTSPVNDEYWGDDVLGSYVVPTGRNATITIRNVGECVYDMLMVFEDGDVVTDQVDVCGSDSYTIDP